MTINLPSITYLFLKPTALITATMAVSILESHVSMRTLQKKAFNGLIPSVTKINSNLLLLSLLRGGQIITLTKPQSGLMSFLMAHKEIQA